MTMAKKITGEGLDQPYARSAIQRGRQTEGKTARSEPAAPAKRGKASQNLVAPATADAMAAVSAPAVDNPVVITPEERCRMIAEAAFLRAERRGFNGGQEQARQDWLEAEAEVDRALRGDDRE